MKMEQISLFDDEFILLNDAATAIKALQPDNALKALKNYRDFYPRGQDIEGMTWIATFLKEGFSALPPSGPDRPSHLFRLWKSFEAFDRSPGHCGMTIEELRQPFFCKIADAIKENHLTDSDFLAERVPLGYTYLQIEEWDRAIRSLQANLIATPDNAATYGYLGDAYWMRGDRETARQVYFEACLIDPTALDWRHLRDQELKDLLDSLPEEYGYDPPLATEWLPVCAYIKGLFRPKLIRLREEFKVFTGGYFELKKLSLHTPSPSLTARLFLRGIVLCDNDYFLRMCKGIDFTEIRREMKAADAIIFAEYLQNISRRK
jgi:tetratricopeptide (TPR) repeat protein